MSQRWRYYKRLRREGYSEAEALDESQITRECCRATISTQTDVHLRVYAAGRPVTDDSGQRTVQNISRYPAIETFGVLSDVPPKPVVGPANLNVIGYQVYEGDVLSAEEDSLFLMGVDVFGMRDQADQQRRERAEVANRAEAQPKRGVLRKPAATQSSESAPDHPAMRRAGFGDLGSAQPRVYRVNQTSSPTSRIAGSSAAKVHHDTVMTLRSRNWNEILWNIGSSYDISNFGDVFRTPLVPRSRTLSLMIQLFDNISTELTIEKNSDITPLDVLTEVDNFVNSPLSPETIDSLLFGEGVEPLPFVAWALHVSRHTPGATASLYEVRNMSGRRMMFHSFTAQPDSNSWVLKMTDSNRLNMFETIPELSNLSLAAFQSSQPNNEDPQSVDLTLQVVSPSSGNLLLKKAKFAGAAVTESFGELSDEALNVIMAFHAPQSVDIERAFRSTGYPIVFVLSNYDLLLAFGDVTFDGRTFSPK